MVDYVERFRIIANDLADLYERKNNDYGNSTKNTFDKYGPVSFGVRLSDKLNRFDQLAIKNTSQKVKDESVIDTLLDLASYAIQAAMLIEEKNKVE